MRLRHASLVVVLGIGSLVAGASLEVGDEKPVAASWTAGTPAAALGNGEYLVVWSDGSLGKGGSADIYGLRLETRTLAPLDATPIPVSRAPGAQYMPVVAFSGGRYLVVWEDFRGERNTTVYGALIEGGTGKVLASDVPISSGDGNRARPDVVGYPGGFLVAWQQIQNRDQYAIFGVRVSREGKLEAEPAKFAEAGARPQLGVSGSRALLVWSSGTYRGHLEARRIGLPAGNPDQEFGRVNTCCPDDVSLAPDGKGNFWIVSSREPFPNPWGWPGPGAVTFSRVLADDSTPEAKLEYGPRHTLLSERKVPNVIDAADWGGAGYWDAGAVGGFPGTGDALWPHGMATAAFDESGKVVVAWVRGDMEEDRLSLSGFDVWVRGFDAATLKENLPPVRIQGQDSADELRPLLVYDGVGGFLLLYQKIVRGHPRALTARSLRLE